MRKRLLAVVFAAAAAFAAATPSAQAQELDCQRICLWCDPTGQWCDDCVDVGVFGDPMYIC